MKKIVLIIVGLLLILTAAFFIIRQMTRPREEHPIFHPLPAHTLKTPSGESIQIPEAFPDQDYLLLFFIENSPTSLIQLAELSRIADTLPAHLALLAIHPGRMSTQPPDWISPRLHLLLDPEAGFTHSMEIRTVPTLYLLTRQYRQLAFAEHLVPAETLATYPSLLRGATP